MSTPTHEPLAHPLKQPPLEQGYSAVNENTAHAGQQLVLHNKFITHPIKAGLNPLVDAAGYLFSIIGKLKHLKFYRQLNHLHKELVSEINHFQDVIKAQGYSSEYILVSRYVICATFDDIITNTSWGTQGQWDNYSLLTTFNQESTRNERFFMILERVIADPALYIDVMELMYVCLSLGFKGGYRLSEFSHNQLEQITHALYKRIRAYRGDFSRQLSPFPIKATPIIQTPKTKNKASLSLTLLITASMIMLMFIGLGYLLDTISNHAYEALLHIGKSILYDTQVF